MSKDFKGQVVDKLVAEYTVTEVEAKELLDEHKSILEKGIGLGSFAYYVSDEIAVAAKLKLREIDEDDDEEMDEDLDDEDEEEVEEEDDE